MKRIDRLLKLIPQNTPLIADIGTDHAYLPIRAITERKVKKVYASDINPRSLEQARANLKRHHLEQSSKIKLVCSDGLDFVKNLKEIEIDYVIIAGLGSNKIRHIIEEPNKKIRRYLILSNNEVSLIRQWAKSHNYDIEYEDFFYANQRPYWLILINPQLGSQFTGNDLEFGSWKRWYSTNRDYLVYLQELRERYLQYHDAITTGSAKKKNQDYINRIEKYLKQWS